MDPGGAPGFTGPGGSAWVRGSMGAIWDYIAKIVSMVIELPRSTQLNILYFIVTDYNTLIRAILLSVYVKSPYRTPRDYITLVGVTRVVTHTSCNTLRYLKLLLQINYM